MLIRIICGVFINRLDMDLKALDSAKYILINNALELLDKIKVLDFLKQPQYLDVICSTFNIKHENKMFNC